MKRRTLLQASLGSALLLALPACTDDDGDGASASSSNLPRDVADPAAAKEFAAAEAAFSWDFYRQLAAKDGNLFVSPFSIANALAQVTAGARGDTAAELQRALHIDSLGDRAYAGAGALDLSLTSGANDDTFRLKVANSAWTQNGFAFEKPYLDLLARYFGSEMRSVDFKAAAEPARKEINNWVADRTQGKIRDLMPEGSVTTLTRLVLANAIYFNARWETEFHPSTTQEGDFKKLDGSNARAQMMSRRGQIAYSVGDRVSAVELPYKGGRFRMAILLPDEGTFAKFEATLDGAKVDMLLSAMKPGDIQLSMPKFAFSFAKSLKPAFQGLGVNLAFDDDRADFSGMSIADRLYLSDIFHKAVVRVDERGTEASAATGVVVNNTSMPREFRADRPFIFLIRDSESGAVLFAGRLVEPVFDA